MKKKPIALIALSNNTGSSLQNIEKERKISKEALKHYDDNFSKLTDAEKTALVVLSILPAESIPFAILKTLMKDEALNQTLLMLVDKGWLDFDEANASFRISPVIQDVVKAKNENLRQQCQALIDNLQLELKKDRLDIDNYEHSTIYAKYASAVVGQFPEGDFDVIILFQRIGNFYAKIGDLNNALIFHQKQVEASKILVQLEPNNADYKNGLATSYGDLSGIFLKLGHLEKALSIFDNTAQLFKQLYKNFPNNADFKNGLAISYEKLGETHTGLGNFKTALAFFENQNQLSYLDDVIPS